MEVKLCMRRGVPNLKCTPWGAKNDTIFLNMMLLAMLSFMYSDFLCLFSNMFMFNMFMFNSVKQCKS